MTRCVGYPTLKGHENPNDGDYMLIREMHFRFYAIVSC